MKIKYLPAIFKAWWKWRNKWDDLCSCCGKCCYTRLLGKEGEVIIRTNAPCIHLDTQTQLCRIYQERFKKCDHCGKVTMFIALFHPTLPNDCAYRKTFRLWEKGKN